MRRLHLTGLILGCVLTLVGRMVLISVGWTTLLAAYSSERLLPPGTRRWREVGVRDLITTTTADEVRITPGHSLQTPLNRNIPLDRWPVPFDLPAAEKEEQGTPALLERVDEAKAHELTFTNEECSALAEVLQWHGNGKQGPPPPGVQRTWDTNGAPGWQVPTFGKAGGFATAQANGWPWIAGVYAGSRSLKAHTQQDCSSSPTTSSAPWRNGHRS